MDLVEFLTARLDEDSRAALVATACSDDGTKDAEQWHVRGDIVVGDDGSPAGILIARPRWSDPGILAHVARHDPAWVLADVAAKRAILALHEKVEADDWDGFACRTCGLDGGAFIAGTWPCSTLCLLTQPHADHPDFDPAWKVET